MLIIVFKISLYKDCLFLLRCFIIGKNFNMEPQLPVDKISEEEQEEEKGEEEAEEKEKEEKEE